MTPFDERFNKMMADTVSGLVVETGMGIRQSTADDKTILNLKKE